MLSNADSQDLQPSAAAATNGVRRVSNIGAEKMVQQKIWLPRILYVSLPWFYLAAGIGAFLATLYINAWFWILPHYVLFSIGCIHLGLVVLRRRRGHRRNRTTTEADSRR